MPTAEPLPARVAAKLAPWRATHPLACKVVSDVAEHGFLADAVGYLLETRPDYLPSIAPYVDALARLYERRGASIDMAVEALLAYTVEYMRHQVSFVSTGKYSQTDFEEVFAQVYDNAELMGQTYLPGLYMTQLFWPVHSRVLDVYLNEFLPALGQPTTLLEVGVGHGLTALSGLQRFPEAHTVGLDVSAHALSFARDLLTCAGLDSRCQLRSMDITKEAVAGLQADGATMGEILEHVSQPERALSNLRAMLRDDAQAFITTVIDSNAIDHIYQFESQSQIDELIASAGFELQRSELLVPAEMRLDGSVGSDPTRFYFGIVRAS